MLSVTVSDNGKGIQEKDLPHIFDRFYQGGSHSSQQIGTGIGLHFVKSLIELHHGTIEVESIPNLQTTFKITIPNDKSAYLEEEFYNSVDLSDKPQLDVSGYVHISEEEAIQHIEKKKKDKRKKILIVEDNADIRNYIKNILGTGFIFEEAENGQVALDLMELHEFDLVISDIMMPVMDGIEMCNLMKSSIETDHIPIILLTAKTDIENHIEGLSVGADSYITKPFHPKHLKVSVTKLIELRDLLKERYSRKIIFGEFNSIQQETDSPEEIFLRKAISVVLEKMIDSEFSGNNLAKELNLSRMGLHRKIKALTGQATGEFIRNLRLKKARDLLTIEGKNVSDVCYEVGFSSPSYFSTCFNVLYKMSPSEYVRKFKKDE
jgi:CheY-like chemotaxis protein